MLVCLLFAPSFFVVVVVLFRGATGWDVVSQYLFVFLCVHVDLMHDHFCAGREKLYRPTPLPYGSKQLLRYNEMVSYMIIYRKVNYTHTEGKIKYVLPSTLNARTHRQTRKRDNDNDNVFIEFRPSAQP